MSSRTSKARPLKLISVLSIRKYFLLSIISSLIFISVYLYTQVLGIVQNLDVWFASAPLVNLILFVFIAALFGVTVSFQVYRWKQPKACTAKGTVGVSSGASFLGFLVAQCPACASLGALL